MNRTILVAALNPCIDAEWRVERVLPLEKNTVLGERRWAGGKGINVVRWLGLLGTPGRLLVPLGGQSGKALKRMLRELGLKVSIVPVIGESRVNVIVTPEMGGPQYRFNPLGPRFTGEEWRHVKSRLNKELQGASFLMLSGSLPRGVPASAYALMARQARSRGVRVILDCDGEALRAGVAAKPFLVKPNSHELAEWFGRPLGSTEAVKRAARSMSDRTGGYVLVSRDKEGAVLINTREGVSLSAAAPVSRVLNTVGAGDAMVAAVAARMLDGSSPAVWLQWGVASGTVATRHLAGVLPSSQDISRAAAEVEVTSTL